VEDERNVNMVQWWKQTLKGESRSTRRRVCPNSTFTTASHKWIGLWSYPTSAVTDRQTTIWDTARPQPLQCKLFVTYWDGCIFGRNAVNFDRKLQTIRRKYFHILCTLNMGQKANSISWWLSNNLRGVTSQNTTTLTLAVAKLKSHFLGCWK